jgi:hypothetical protein
MTDEFLKADINGDGVISPEEFQLELKRKSLEIDDADAQRDQIRRMIWFVLFGMLGYPLFVIGASLVGLDKAADILGSMATIYFPATSLILASFFGASAYQAKKAP